MTTHGYSKKALWFGYPIYENRFAKEAIANGVDPDKAWYAPAYIRYLTHEAGMYGKAHIRYFRDEDDVRCIFLALATNAPRGHDYRRVSREKPAEEVYAKLTELLGMEPGWYELDT